MFQKNMKVSIRPMSAWNLIGENIQVPTPTARVRPVKATAVPLDFSANPPALARLKRDLGVSGHRELLDALHVDIVDLRGVVDPVYRI